ncbi:uncharacterized protein N7473_007037 [Penicillium subrubescens]|uniref:uncharacterized protein n=1 Tax=Penicillium subrubescens TaxID=1316194 RepID=UPI002544F388|nr:uncharacterized protein N7473_007037 [Penicillium subrubescens]KAJ5890809.1 hypothetical protein N7473_007037 [Penicillium subrubescens]
MNRPGDLRASRTPWPDSPQKSYVNVAGTEYGVRRSKPPGKRARGRQKHYVLDREKDNHAAVRETLGKVTRSKL